MRLPAAPRLAAACALALLVSGAPPGSSAEDVAVSAEDLVEAYARRFARIGPESLEGLDRLYGADVRFRDPITEVRGLEALTEYFRTFVRQAEGAEVRIDGTLAGEGEAAVFWTMRLPGGESDPPGRSFSGVSHLRFRDRIYEQRDYFDLGEAVYEHVPVLGWLTRRVKARLD
jgi:hypothetical protein